MSKRLIKSNRRSANIPDDLLSDAAWPRRVRRSERWRFGAGSFGGLRVLLAAPTHANVCHGGLAARELRPHIYGWRSPMRSISTTAAAMGLASGETARRQRDWSCCGAPFVAACADHSAGRLPGWRGLRPKERQLAHRRAAPGFLDPRSGGAGIERRGGRSAAGRAAGRGCAAGAGGRSLLHELSVAGCRQRTDATGNAVVACPQADGSWRGHPVHAGVAAASLHGAGAVGRCRVSG